MIVVRAVDDGFVLEHGIAAFDQANDVVGCSTPALREDDAHLDTRIGKGL